MKLCPFCAEEIQDVMDRDQKDNPFRGLADVMTGSVQLEWGWAVMIAGVGLLVVAALIDRRGVSLPALIAALGLLVLAGLYASIVLY